jgi:hypothetical protein
MNSNKIINPENIIVEQINEITPLKVSTFNILSGYPSSHNSTKKRDIKRSSASRNVISNALGFKNPLMRHKATIMRDNTKGEISYASTPVKYHATRSVSPQAKHIGGKRRKTLRRSTNRLRGRRT